MARLPERRVIKGLGLSTGAMAASTFGTLSFPAIAPFVRDCQHQSTVTKAQGVVQHNDGTVLVPVFGHTVIPGNAQIDVPVADLAHDVCRTLQPHLQLRDSRNRRHILPDVALGHVQAALIQKGQRFFLHAALAGQPQPDHV